jgi:hypothetical protein
VADSAEVAEEEDDKNYKEKKSGAETKISAPLLLLLYFVFIQIVPDKINIVPDFWNQNSLFFRTNQAFIFCTQAPFPRCPL